MPFYEYDDASFFSTDGAPESVVQARREGFERLAATFSERAPNTLAMSEELEESLSDVAFVNAYRVPFQFRALVRRRLRLGCVVAETDGQRVKDLDGNWSYDLGGSYG